MISNIKTIFKNNKQERIRKVVLRWPDFVGPGPGSAFLQNFFELEGFDS